MSDAMPTAVRTHCVRNATDGRTDVRRNASPSVDQEQTATPAPAYDDPAGPDEHDNTGNAEREAPDYVPRPVGGKALADFVMDQIRRERQTAHDDPPKTEETTA